MIQPYPGIQPKISSTVGFHTDLLTPLVLRGSVLLCPGTHYLSPVSMQASL